MDLKRSEVIQCSPIGSRIASSFTGTPISAQTVPQYSVQDWFARYSRDIVVVYNAVPSAEDGDSATSFNNKFLSQRTAELEICFFSLPQHTWDGIDYVDFIFTRQSVSPLIVSETSMTMAVYPNQS